MNNFVQRLAAIRSTENGGRKSILHPLSLVFCQRGVVLIAVLWCCALVMWFAFEISAQTRLHGEDELHAIRESHALYLAIGGCYEALARMGPPLSPMMGRSAGPDWQPDGQPRVVKYKSGIAVVIAQPEDLKINVNMVRKHQLIEVLQRAGADESTAQKLAERILDFDHSGDISSLRNTQNDSYIKPGGYVPFGGPLTSLDQLLLIPGVTPRLFYGYGRGMDEKMREFPGIFKDILIPADNSLFSLLTIYGSNVNMPRDLSGQQREPASQSMVWRPGGIYRIMSFGKSASGPPSVGIRLTVSYAGIGDKPYRILGRNTM